MTEYPRGSEWRKWDLHVHTPCSIVEKYGGNNETTWESFIQDLEALPPSFKVIGVNDYLFLDGYKRLLKEKSENNRLQNIDLLLPVVEFRIKKFAGTDFGAFKRINLHIIFSETIAPETIETQFLNAITSSYQLAYGVEESFWSGVISIESLRDLGKKIKESVPEDKISGYGTDLIEGFNNLNVDEEKIFEVLTKSSYFKGKFLTAVGKTEWDALKWSDSSIAEKKNIINQANIVFTAAEDAKAYFTARGKLIEQSVNSLLLDCSDSHSFSHASNDKDKIGNCLTWIKSNPSFDGLKQIIFEPEERIHIGDEHPDSRDQNKIIKSIQIENANGWFSDQEIPLNPYQVSIIGGKGSGKTALLDLIAFAANSWDEKVGESFLKKANRNLQGTRVKLNWAGGEESTQSIERSLSTTSDEPKVKYLSQSFVEDLCSKNQDGQELIKEIENVVFEYIEETDRHGYTDFHELKQAKLDAIYDERKSISRQIEDINIQIVKEQNQIKTKDEKLKLKANLEREKAGLIEQKPDLGSDEERALESSLQELRSERQKIIEQIAKLKSQVDKARNIDLKLRSFTQTIESFYSEIEYDLIEIGINDDDRRSFIPKFPENTHEILNLKVQNLQADIQLLVDGDEKTETKTQVDLDKQINDCEAKLSEDIAKQAKILKIQKRITDIEKEILNIEKLIKEIDEVRSNRLKMLENKRWGAIERYFSNLRSEEEVLIRLYSPLDQYLVAATQEKKSLEFYIRWDLRLEEWAKKGESLINRIKKGPYRVEGELLAAAKAIIAPALQSSENSQYRDAISEFRSTFDSEEFSLSSQLKEDVSEDKFNNWLYGLDHIKLRYGIKYNEIELENLSPGTKGIVLLILYLEMDKNDTRPILIDQPEENLDNESVYKILTQYFRVAKKRRQVIVVTHNPNLVVNTDSEQVVVASFNSGIESEYKISYQSGALEYSNRTTKASEIGIREKVCEILEGGQDAFHKREQKYDFV